MHQLNCITWLYSHYITSSHQNSLAFFTYNQVELLFHNNFMHTIVIAISIKKYWCMLFSQKTHFYILPVNYLSVCVVRSLPITLPTINRLGTCYCTTQTALPYILLSMLLIQYFFCKRIFIIDICTRQHNTKVFNVVIYNVIKKMNKALKYISIFLHRLG